MSATPDNAEPRRSPGRPPRADFRAAQGVLLVVRTPPPAPPPVKGQPALVAGNPAEGVEILIAVWDDGSVTALNGHVDLGTGIRTALARHWLVAQAAERLGVPVDQLQVRAGVVQVTADPSRQLAYGALLAGAHNTLELMDATPTKAAADYTVVGQSVPRVDIPAKVSGELVFVHDMRVPGMLHGRVVRPPYAGADHGDFIGNTLESVDQQSIAHIPGIRAVVVIRDFVGIVAEREEQAEQALRDLKVHWKDWPGFPRQDSPEAIAQAIRANPATQRRLVDEGDVDAAMAAADQPMPRTYVWPYQMHGSIGPSCAVAEWRSDDSTGRPRMTVWAGTQNPHVLRADLARLVGLADVDIDLIRMEAQAATAATVPTM